MVFRVEGDTEDIDDIWTGPELLLELLVRITSDGTCSPLPLCGRG
jgi:hypothetical protein